MATRIGFSHRIGLIVLFVLLIGQLAVPAPPARSQQPAEDPAAPSACPAAPAGLPSTIERPNFCIYYNVASATAAQATTAADHVQAYWDRYDTDFGFLAPSFTGKLEVQLVNDAGCNGGTSSGSNVMDTYTGCFGTPESIKKVLGHELFHRVQYSYDGGEVRWFKEGTARAMEDLAFSDIDNWATTLTAVSSSFNKQVNTYLSSTNADITSDPMRYNSALWWKYFTEQYGSTPGEPQRGVDAFLRLWEAADTHDDIAAINQALTALGAGTDFNEAFRRFTVANWTKDLSGVPDSSYNYADEDQAGNGAPYGPLVPTNGGTIAIGTPATFSNQTVTRYGARYYQATPGANCPVISATFHKDNGPDAFYHIVTQKGTVFSSHREGSATDWSMSFLNDGITKIVAIIGGQANPAQVDVTLSCVTPTLDIKLPNNGAVAYVGPFATPGKFLAQVLVTNGSPTGPVVAGLTTSDFKVRVNGLDALVTGGGFIQEQYWLVVQAPAQAANGTYDLEVTLEASGTATPIATDTNAASVTYVANNGDQVLVIDRSGSMGWGSPPRLPSAQAAANFYIDITRTNDGLAVVPFDNNVSPAPFAMQSVTVAVRNNAKNFVNALTPGGATSIGDGLQAAVAQRAASPTGNPRCSFVLLSDGMENSAALWASVQAAVVASGCPVTSIAFGPESDETLMQAIATATGGIFFYNDVSVSTAPTLNGVSATPADMALDLGSTYEFAQSHGEGRQRLLAQKGSIPFPPAVQVHKVLVDSSVSEMLFALDWNQRGVEMDFKLRRPDGSIVDSSTLPYTFADFASGHLGWRIPNPAPGTWQMLVTHQGGGQTAVPYQVIASGRSALSLDLLLADRLNQRKFTGNRIPILAFLSADHPIADALVEALVTAPDGTPTRLRLFDDGQHDDGVAGDGFYGNLYTRSNQATPVAPAREDGGDPTVPKDEGGYRVSVRASGATFERESLGSFAVLEAPDTNQNGLPDPYEQEQGLAGADADPDLDGLDNLSEYQSGTDPLNSDSDGGGENDGSEILQHQLDPLDAADDQIAAPAFLQATPGNGAVLLTYDVKSEYNRLVLYRATSQNGPWLLRQAELPAGGSYSDPATNGEVYFYRLMAIDADDHRSAVIDNQSVKPLLDPIPPEARVRINNNAPSTESLNVLLSFAPYEETGSFNDIAQVLISNSPTFSGASWQPFSQNIPWTLQATAPGSLARVYVRFRDSAGNESVGTEVGSIIYSSGTQLYLPLVMR